MCKTVLLIIFFNIFCDIAYGQTYYPCSKEPHKGEPIQIVTFGYDENEKKNKFAINSTGLESILLRPEVSEKELVILSIAGSFRKGKSFFLDLVLQYLEGNGVLEANKVNLSHGFHWTGGSEHDTQGMLMWSEPFCVKSQSGKELAILLMDTQGAFDSQQSFGDTSIIFALSFLTSSIQLYNLKEQIQEDDLQNLQVFTTYGSQISGDGNKSYKPFQELIFLIRDWPYPKERMYGAIGGQNYLEKVISEGDKPEKGKTLRNEIKSYFSNLTCFLMPHPGEKVASGEFLPSDIKPDFIKEVNEFSSMVFNTSNLVTKQIAGKNINGRKMYESLKVYLDAFANNEKIKPETIHDATCRANNIIVFGDSKLYYTDEMNKKCFQMLSVEPIELQQHYEKVRKDTIEKYNKTKQSGCEVSSKTYLIDLEKWIEQQYSNCTTKNFLLKINETTTQLKKSLDSIENLNKTLTTCSKEKGDINVTLSNCNIYLNTSQTSLNTCNTNLSSSQTDKENFKSERDICNTFLSTNQTSLNTCNTNLYSNQTEKNEFKTKLDTCKGNLESMQTNLNDFKKDLNDCNTYLRTNKTRLTDCASDLNNVYIIASGDSGHNGCYTYNDCYYCRNHNRCCFNPSNMRYSGKGICTCVDGVSSKFGISGYCN